MVNVCLVAGVVLQGVVAASHELLRTGAVPGDEFYFAGFLYRHLVLMQEIAWGLVAVGLLASARPLYLPAFAAFVLLAAALAMDESSFAAAAALIHWFAHARDCRRKAIASESAQVRLAGIFEALRSIRVRTLLRWLVPLWIISALGAYGVTLAESFLYSQQFAPRLFERSQLWVYRARLLPISVQCALVFAGLYLCLPALARLCVAAMRLLRVRRESTVVWLAASQGVLMSALLAAATMLIVGDELRKNRVLAEAFAFLVLVFHLWFCAIERAFSALDFEMPGRESVDASMVLRVAACAPLSLPLSFLGAGVVGRCLASRRFFFSLQAVGAALWLALLCYTAYPELEDFRSYFISIGVFAAIHVVSLGWLAVWSASARGRLVARDRALLVAAVVLAGLLALDFCPMPGNTALIRAEYARFGYVVSSTGPKHRLLDPNRLGFSPAAMEFVPHDSRADRFPSPGIEAIQQSPPPIVMILWDAGRPDRMGCYGNPRNTTPNADRLARDSVVFERAYSMATATTCGVRHLFTGRYSTRFMMSTHHDPFFVHALRRHGYHDFYVVATGSDFNGVSIDAFLRGGPSPDSDGTRFVHLGLHPSGAAVEAPDHGKVDSVLKAWKQAFAERGGRGLDGSLTFIHLTGTHFPWFNEHPVENFGDDMLALYDGEMAKVDQLTGEVLELLRESGAYEKSIILLFADHGTGLLEHGRWGGFLPYEEQIRIPLLVKLPGVAPGRSSAVVASIDLAPTLVGLFAPGEPNPYDGVSLLPTLLAAASGERVDPPRRYVASLCAFEDAYALIEDGRWKLHFHRLENYSLLFDLAADPGETRNVFDREPMVAARLIEVMRSFLWTGRRGYANPSFYRDWTPPEPGD